ncbi:MAG: homoserine O-acetyltransferase [Clostridiales bacterium]|nr:homoserine O-acetyltransferase [Clostridiales bacterium]
MIRDERAVGGGGASAHASEPPASGPRIIELSGGFDLVSGHRLEHVAVAYETFGTLDEMRANAVLVCHALSGDAHVANGPDRFGEVRPGWWEPVVGPGKAIDTERYFVICANVLGGCSGTTGPGSTDPATNSPYGLRFPLVTIEDMVDVQAALLNSLGIERLACVVGGSMGGMQALRWAQRHPDRVASVAVIATTWRLAAQAIAFNEVGRTAILGDQGFTDGDYYERGQPSHGLAVARMIGHITYLSDDSMRAKFGRRLRDRAEHAFEFVTEFEVESYLAYQGRKFVERFDANTYLYMTKAMDYFDLSAGYPSLADALAGMSARVLVLSFSSDWLFPTYQARELVDALKAADAEVSFAEIQSPYGHDAFLLEPEQQRRYLEPFLARIVAEERARKTQGRGGA